MNWIRLSLRKLAWRTLLLGGAAGAWAVLLMDLAEAAAGRLGAGASAQGALGGLAFGLGVGLFLTPIGEFLGHYWRRLGRAALLGAACGGLFGLIGVGAAAAITDLPRAGAKAVAGVAPGTVYALAFPPALCLLAAALGAASGMAISNRKIALNRARLGALAGLAAGLPAAGAALLPNLDWLMALALVFWSAAVAQVMFWGERRFARHWLRILTGPGEDEFFPLPNSTVTIGKLESNDLPLAGYNEVFPVHCRLAWVNGQYKIVDDESGGMVYVNFRPTQEQILRQGDLVKIGTALLQYGEA